MSEKRDDEIKKAAEIHCSLFECSIGFELGAKWSDTHPSKEIIEKIINMAFDGWDSISSFSDLAQTIKEEIWDNTETGKANSSFEPFDIVIYKPTKERGLVKKVTDAGVFVLFGIQSTSQLCQPESLIKV